MTESTAGAGADDSAAISPNTPIQGGTGSLTITVPGCVYIGSPQPSPDQPMSPAQGATPTGAILPYAGEMAPEGYLLCNGAEINRTTYASLFGVIGSTYGVGNGNTTFHLPDLRGRFPLGLDNMGGTSADVVTAAEADSLASSGGAETHTLTIDEMPAHAHDMGLRHNENIDHEGFAPTGSIVDEDPNPSSANLTLKADALSAIAGQSGHGHSTYWRIVGNVPGALMKNTGGGQAHNNMPPYLSLNYIIKT